MRYRIIDSNYLRRPELRAYLEASRSNGVVLMDLISVEMHKKNAASSARASTAILRDFPRRTMVLRPTASFYHWQLYSSAKVGRLEDAKQTRGFDGYVHGLHDPDDFFAAERHAQIREAEAVQVIAQLTRDSRHIPKTFKDFTKSLRPEQVVQMRKRVGGFDKDLQFRLLNWSKDIAVSLVQKVVTPPRYSPNQTIRLTDTFVFRYALCIVLLYTHWVYYGQSVDRSTSKFTNDVVDMHVAALSTFFAGVLSADQAVLAVEKQARFILRSVGSYVG